MYLVIAYRWGSTNDHWYFVYCGDDFSKATALAENERDGRGGKYGVAVHEAADKGERLELRQYFGSSGETEPTHNWRIDYFERLGHVLESFIDGRLMIPNELPDERGMMCMHCVELPVDPVLRTEVLRHRKMFDGMQEAYERARADAAERAAQVFCPVCDSGPVYAVEYACSFWRVPRDETSGNVDVDALEGNWCRSCEQLHLMPDQIARNQHRVRMARLKAEPA